MESKPSDGEVAVFTDTNMDTHIAMGISPDITVADFKIEVKCILEVAEHTNSRKFRECQVNLRVGCREYNLRDL